MDYGVSNATGKYPEADVRALLEVAQRAQIRIVDTASAYGDSEAVLGRNLPKDAFALVTKTIVLTASRITQHELDAVERAFRQSLQLLQVESIYAVLVHHAQNLLVPGGDALYRLLEEWQRAGTVRKIGASVYDGAEVQQLLRRYRLDLVQLPLNVFDQRMLNDGSLAALRTAGAEIHVRSVFLQGVLLMREDELPGRLQRLRAPLADYRRHLDNAGCSPLEAALGFIKHLEEVDVAVIGISSLPQLQDCLQSYDRARGLQLAQFALSDPQLVDPRRWSVQ